MTYKQFLGIPFVFKGRTKKGTDCLGLSWMYLRARGYTFPERDGLPFKEEVQRDYLPRAMAALSKMGTQVEQPAADDIVLMRLPGGYTHMGVMVDESNILHVLKNRPSATEPLARYRHRIVGIYRLAPGRRRKGVGPFFRPELKEEAP